MNPLVYTMRKSIMFTHPFLYRENWVNEYNMNKDNDILSLAGVQKKSQKLQEILWSVYSRQNIWSIMEKEFQHKWIATMHLLPTLLVIFPIFTIAGLRIYFMLSLAYHLQQQRTSASFYIMHTNQWKGDSSLSFWEALFMQYLCLKAFKQVPC